MLRSQGIPSRVVLGYRCDEWHEDQQCYQVRQLHAHAWVEAFLDPDQVPEDPSEAARQRAGSLDARRLAAIGSDTGGRVGHPGGRTHDVGGLAGPLARPATLLGQVHRGHGSHQAARVGL